MLGPTAIQPQWSDSLKVLANVSTVAVIDRTEFDPVFAGYPEVRYLFQHANRLTLATTDIGYSRAQDIPKSWRQAHR